MRYPFSARLVAVDNAREEVTDSGRIVGILAANSPHNLLRGFWHRPTPRLIPFSVIGLTGANGRLWAEYSLGPIGAAGLFAANQILFRLPEPEVLLPPGTDMLLSVTAFPATAPSFPRSESTELPDALSSWVAEQPYELKKPGGRNAADIINFAFTGTSEQLVQAFTSAGWFPADALTRRTFSLAYRSYSARKPYPTAPVSKLLYQSSEPDFVFQKSLNTIARRHHIRIWNAGRVADTEVWLGAATHDVGIGFDSGSASFVHKIEPRIDLERRKVANDLDFAGCAESIAYVDRPGAARVPGKIKGIVTDGRVAVVSLKECSAPPASTAEINRPELSKASRFVRRLVLETRQYLFRNNAYYWAFRALAWKPANSKSVAIEE
jgi:hypothetical protein